MSETKKRILLAVVLLFLLSLILTIQIPFNFDYYFIVLILSALGIYEFFEWQTQKTKQNKNNFISYQILTYLSTFLIVTLFYFSHLQAVFFKEIQISFLPFVFFVILLHLLIFVCISIVIRKEENFLFDISLQVFMLIYGVSFISHALLYLNDSLGTIKLLYFLLIPALTDSCAYFTGKLFGRTNANIRISKNKTWEGFLGGIFITACIIFFVNWLLESVFLINSDKSQWFGNLEILLLSIALSIITILADLFESGIKRSLAIKDSSNIFPGHGGYFDLMDSFLWSIPFGYYYLVLREYVLL